MSAESVSPLLATATQAAGTPVRCGFLFNHDQLHQVAHSAPIAFDLMRSGASVQTILLATTQPQYDYLKRLLVRYGLPTEQLHLVDLPRSLRPVAALLDPLLPFSRVGALLANLGSFRELDVLVTPEKTSLLLRSLSGLSALKMVHTRHGAGDRAVGFDRHSGEFDLVLMSGGKIRDRLLRAGLLKQDGYAIVGYPKFNLCAARRERLKLFDNDLPTVLYNPHCSPRLSSWYRHGLDVLEAFYRSAQYNLIVAPHVMLFRRKLQISLDPLRLNFPGRIPARYYDCPHIFIDTGSFRSCDMTYTEAADCYLGDASSQIYEFLRRPRPCAFIDAHGANWREDPNYTHWQCGPVIENIEGFMRKIDEAFVTHPAYLETQRSMFAYSIDISETPSSQRGAAAIMHFIQRTFWQENPGRRRTQRSCAAEVAAPSVR